MLPPDAFGALSDRPALEQVLEELLQLEVSDRVTIPTVLAHCGTLPVDSRLPASARRASPKPMCRA